jgi:3',5'-cyclic AMP phosphodiesterase CpdA
MDNIDEEQLPSKLESNNGVVHLEYDIHNPPRTPPDTEESGRWTRFVCISDTHSQVFPVPPGDVLLHSGDLTNTGRQNDFRITMDWICSLPHPIKM